VGLGQIYVEQIWTGTDLFGQSGSGTGLRWTKWHWDGYAVDRLTLTQVYGGWIGTGTGLQGTEWDWNRYVVDREARGTDTDLWWTEWDWDRFALDRVGLG
jgi:hypothetical protein